MCSNPKCPHCCEELILIDTADLSYDNEMFVLTQLGECPECGRQYQWYESAVLTQWANTDLKII